MTEQLAGDIIGRIAKVADVPPESLSTDSELDQLGVHSLELTELIFDLEEEYGIEVEMDTSEAWANLKTIGDVVREIDLLIAKKA